MKNEKISFVRNQLKMISAWGIICSIDELAIDYLFTRFDFLRD